MRSSIFIFSLLFSIFLCVGCKSSKEKIEDTINQMKSTPVSIPFSYMSCWINDTIQIDRPWENAKLKLVVYTDTSSCSKCTLKQMYLWNDFVELEKKYKNDFYIFFVFQTNPGINSKKLALDFDLIEFNHLIYVDSLSMFSSDNPHIPFQDPMFQIFLLDEKNEVILVGHPLFNTKVEDALLEMLKEKLK